MEDAATPATETTNAQTVSNIRIVVLQRGFVVIGRFSQNGTECRIDDGYYIRRWGTTSGLGQLAREGAQTNTVLDRATTIRVHELGIVHSLDVNPQVWSAQWK